MTAYQKILAGVHFREPGPRGDAELNSDSAEAVDRALGLAVDHGARLTFAHVFPVEKSAWARLEHDPGADRVVTAIRAKMQTLVDHAKVAGVEADFEFVFGKPWRELVAMVERNGHDLVVVGNRRRAGFWRTSLGTTAQQLMVRCPASVLVVRVMPRRPYENVLLPIDLTPVSAKVLREGLSLLEASPDVRVHVLHVVEAWYHGELHRVGFAREILEHERAREAEAARIQVEALVEQARTETGFDGEIGIDVVGGQPEDTIWHASVQHRIDLIVIGMAGRSGWQGFVVGNTAMKLLPEVDCAILCVRADQPPPG